MTGLPGWFRQRIREGEDFDSVISVLDSFGLNTVCESADCPNRTECYRGGTLTFMILGRVCTRACSFCAVENGAPSPPEKDEPERISRAVSLLGIRHAVVTSVTRDDLEDGGAGQFARTLEAIKSETPRAAVEVLIPDFDTRGVFTRVFPEVIGHNIETIPRLYPRLRPGAGYERSLRVLESAKKHNPGSMTKSALMLGLGETQAEVETAMADLRSAGCDMLCLGQYLRPSESHFPVAGYIPPETFSRLRELALSAGFRAVVSEPLARSSFTAREMYAEAKNGQG